MKAFNILTFIFEIVEYSAYFAYEENGREKMVGKKILKVRSKTHN